MRQNGISVVRTRKHKVTTDSDHKFNIAPNLLDRDFNADEPNQKWAGIALSRSNRRWPKRAFGAARKRGRSNPALQRVYTVQRLNGADPGPTIHQRHSRQ
jgi:transposase InsO family protein